METSLDLHNPSSCPQKDGNKTKNRNLTTKKQGLSNLNTTGDRGRVVMFGYTLTGCVDRLLPPTVSRSPAPIILTYSSIARHLVFGQHTPAVVVLCGRLGAPPPPLRSVRQPTPAPNPSKQHATCAQRRQMLDADFVHLVISPRPQAGRFPWASKAK